VAVAVVALQQHYVLLKGGIQCMLEKIKSNNPEGVACRVACLEVVDASGSFVAWQQH